jgi:photosystem II stability/assembly factor-like uncharacterized protein
MKHITILPVLIFSLIASLSHAQKWQDVTPYGYRNIGASFISKNQGWLTVRDTTSFCLFRILHTNNGGTTWDTCSTFQEGFFPKRFQMVDSLNGFVAGENYPVSTLFYSTHDAGYTWQDITDSVLMKDDGLLDQSMAFYFIDSEKGFYGGLNCLFKTLNGGLSWEQIEIPPDAKPSTPEMNEYRISELYFTGADCGWATGNGLYSCILKTTNGGESWQLAYNPSSFSQNYSQLHFYDSIHGGFVAYPDFIPYLVFTADNFNSVYGANFTEPPGGIFTLQFQNDSTVWVAAEGVNGVILRSQNGGITFDTLNPEGFENTSFRVTDFSFFENSGYAIGSHVFKYIDTLNTAIRQIPFAEKKFSIFPNPSSGNINLSLLSQKSETAQMRIFTTDGRCVWKKSEKMLSGENNFHYSLGGLKPGLYRMEIAGAGYVTSQNFILRR